MRIKMLRDTTEINFFNKKFTFEQGVLLIIVAFTVGLVVGMTICRS
jgi:hypothetical protein